MDQVWKTFYTIIWFFDLIRRVDLYQPLSLSHALYFESKRILEIASYFS